MGLGFPRLSSISSPTLNCAHYFGSSLTCPDQLFPATPFFPTLAQQGLLEYPLFAFYLGNDSSGSLTLGAVDSSIVTNSTRIGWNKVAQFQPFSAESNTSTYLQWAIPITGFSVSFSCRALFNLHPDNV